MEDAVSKQDTLQQVPAQYPVQHEPMAQQVAKGFTSRDYMQDEVKRRVMEKIDFVRVRGIGEHGAIYYKHGPNEDGQDDSYKQMLPVDADRFVRDEFLSMYGIAPADKIKATVETLKIGVQEEVEGVNNDLVQLAGNLYWDAEEAELTSVPPSPCMRELFDSSGTHEIKLNINKMSETIIRNIYRNTLRHLNEHNGIIDVGADDAIVNLELVCLVPFWTWANEDPDTFNDLLKAVATNFMQNKPKGAFVLIGLKRNGKSTFLKMLHILFGRNNTSSVRLSDLNNHGLNGDLWTTMMNAPDEEDEGRGKDLLEAQGNFKSIAAHESLKLRRLYAQSGQWVNSDFMCFFPMNHFPEWKGSGAAACMHRTLPLFFNNDLSRYDNNGKDFAKETYTEQFFAMLLGVVLAIAHYYRDREMVFSDKMKANKEKVAEEVDNITVYLDRFKLWFNGYKSKKLVYADYQMWCAERDLRWQEYSVFNHTLEMRGPKPTSLRVDDRSVRVYRLGDRKGSDFFHEDLVVPKLKFRKVGELMTTDTEKGRRERSVVAMLDEVEEAKNIRVLEDANKKDDDSQRLW